MGAAGGGRAGGRRGRRWERWGYCGGGGWLSSALYLLCACAMWEGDESVSGGCRDIVFSSLVFFVYMVVARRRAPCGEWVNGLPMDTTARALARDSRVRDYSKQPTADVALLYRTARGAASWCSRSWFTFATLAAEW